MNKITLSYSTITNCLQTKNSHNFVNKRAGMKVPDNEFFRKGHEIEKIISDHVSGKQLHENLAHIKHVFPIVQEEDFDPRCKRFVDINDKYQLFALLDGHNPDTKTFLEVKSANSKMWSLGKWLSSYQRKLYVLAYPEYTNSIIITALMDTEKWKYEQPKVYKIPSTEQDKIDAIKFLTDAITVIESKDFTGGLTEGKCLDSFCYYGVNCMFK